MQLPEDSSEIMESGVAKPQNFAPSPDFKWLCDELFLRMEEAQMQGRHPGSSKPVSIKYYEIISHFIKLWRKTVGDDIYPALVLILPYRDRRIYNIKDYTLAKAVCNFLKLPKNSATERRLIRWKKRATRGTRLSKLCVDEIRKRKSEPPKEAPITIDKLNECLDQLVEERNTKGRGFKGLSESAIFRFCLENMSFVELMYFFDIILKNRLIGGQEHKFLNCWHPDAQDYLSVVSDLKTIAYKLWNPAYRLRNDDLSINLGYAFVPHLAKKLWISYDKICSKLKNDFYIEEKMDGERIQLHYMDYGDNLKFLSRRGVDYTYLYGDNTTVGTIAQYMRLEKNVKECVLDCEMVTYDSDRKVVLPFGLVKSSARNALTSEGICTQGYTPLLMVLDLVYLNGTSLVELPLHRRKEYLTQILKPYPHVVEILPFVRCFDESSIKKSLETAIAMGSEGIVLKNYNSKYHIGARNNSWIKIKPEYLEEFGENMDLVIIGRNPGKKDSFMCGLAVYQGEEEDDTERNKEIVDLDSDGEEFEDTESKKIIKKFVSFCVIANGISQEEFKEISRRTRGKWKRSDKFPPPSNLLEFGSKLPEEWIDPKYSQVLEVKARSLDNTESSKKRFKAGCTLHGGYCRRIRDDKDWTGCYSLSELWQDRRSRSSSLRGTVKQTLLKSKRHQRNKVDLSLDHILDEMDSNLGRTNIFQGIYFYVISDYVDSFNHLRITKEKLNSLILRNGGKLKHNVISRHYAERDIRIISGKYTVECKALIHRGYDIINPQWVLDCIESDSVVNVEPSHCFHFSKELMEIARSRVDQYGDSFGNSISERQLSRLLDSITLPSTYKARELELSPELERIPLFLFGNRIIFIADTSSSVLVRELQVKIQLYGGTITTDVYSCNLIIVLNADSKQRGHELRELRSTLAQFSIKSECPPAIPRIVTTQWIDRSIEELCQVPEEDFSPL